MTDTRQVVEDAQVSLLKAVQRFKNLHDGAEPGLAIWNMAAEKAYVELEERRRGN